jgi:hypothetical protein
MAKANAAFLTRSMRPVAPQHHAALHITTVAHAHLIRKTTSPPKASACHKQRVKTATLPTRASANTCNAMACTCNLAL